MKKTSIFFLIGVVSCGMILCSCESIFANGHPPLVATFDSLPEGFAGDPLTDGGITFYDLQWYADIGVEKVFKVEKVGPQYDLGPFFTRPNFLSPCGYSPGAGYGFDRLGSAKITCGMDGMAASMDIFSSWYSASNILDLQAMLNGTVVATDSMNFHDSVFHHRLAISNTRFDTLQLVASGPEENGAVFVAIDNVSITPVPEPATVLLLGLGAVMLRRKS